MIRRRAVFAGAAALAGLGGGLAAPWSGAARAQQDFRRLGGRKVLTPIEAAPDLVSDVTVCLRPFRTAGPRSEAERLGDTLMVHNYGHGGAGWSLSWGSAEIAVGMALQNSVLQSGAREVAVIGCGALGLTAAVTAQRAGAKVTIYARDLLPATRSARATGLWSPDSRIALERRAPAGFGDLWERMARTSWRTHLQYLGLAGSPIDFFDQYYVAGAGGERAFGSDLRAGALRFADYTGRISDITPRPMEVPDNALLFPAYTRVMRVMRFNIAEYGRALMGEFTGAGGVLVQREFSHPSEIAALPEKAVVNCPGYGARSLWRDETVSPVRGQISWLPARPDLSWGFIYKHVLVVPRRDGTLVQGLAGGDMRGFGDDRETPDATETADTVGIAAELYQRMLAFNVATRGD